MINGTEFLIAKLFHDLRQRCQYWYPKLRSWVDKILFVLGAVELVTEQIPEWAGFVL